MHHFARVPKVSVTVTVRSVVSTDVVVENCVCRRYFPQVLKEHRSHDVVLMCIACHQRSNLHDAALKQRLAQETGAPLEAGQNGRYRRDHSVHKVKSAAK